MPSKTQKDETLNVVDGAANNVNGTNNYTINGNFNGTCPTTTGTITLNFHPLRKLESTRFCEKENGNFIEMIFRETPNYNMTTGHLTYGCPQEYMVKEIYGVVDGKLQLISTIRGTERPGYYVEPIVEWEE